ncbi:MAG: alpha/beta hydrolase [Ruminococcaceae bacterium]|nr:alpha/beta hydrolase [Oscillospiraceae bacterium]
MKEIKLWDNIPGTLNTLPKLEYYPAKNKKTTATVLILPGGGYGHLADHEGKGYAEYLNAIGMDAFVLYYRLSPDRFPLQLLDARRALRVIRNKKDEFNIDENRIGIMGSSAGGHLAALASTYTAPIDFEDTDDTDKLKGLPDLTILCYPVIHHPAPDNITHLGTYQNLLGEKMEEKCKEVSPELLVNESTPPAFIWHTSNDGGVNVINSYMYASSLRNYNINHELHVFPDGPHGLGLAEKFPHVAQWSELLAKYLIEIKWL